jgi:hypothetical protein
MILSNIKIDQNKYLLGSLTSCENLNTEYKELTLESLHLYFSEENIKLFIENNNLISKVNFNKCCLNDLEISLLKYLKVYIATFIVTNIHGKLQIGTSDNCIYEGIPYFGDNLPIDLIQKCVNTCFEEYLRIKDCSPIENKKILTFIKQNISFKVDKLEVDELYIDNHYIDRLNDLKIKYNKSNEQWKIYKQQLKKWTHQISKYTNKLQIIINNFNVRYRILKFIRKYAYINKLQTNQIAKAIKFYKSKQLIDFDITYDILSADLKYRNTLNIKNYDEFLNNLDIDYNNYFTWLVIYKDYKIIELKKKKPKRPLNRTVNLKYLMFSKYVWNLRTCLHAQKCNFFLLTFNIPKFETHYLLEYKHVSHNSINWLCKKRILFNDEPITVSIN